MTENVKKNHTITDCKHISNFKRAFLIGSQPDIYWLLMLNKPERKESWKRNKDLLCESKLFQEGTAKKLKEVFKKGI